VGIRVVAAEAGPTTGRLVVGVVRVMERSHGHAVDCGHGSRDQVVVVQRSSGVVNSRDTREKKGARGRISPCEDHAVYKVYVVPIENRRGGSGIVCTVDRTELD
jgi:hypothetical protein